MTSPTTPEADSAAAKHTILQVNNSWARMDVPGGWIYMMVVSGSDPRYVSSCAVFVPEPFAITEADVKHESGKLKVLKAILPLLGRIIRR